MYAKLMARITESSLMEEDILVRYTFIMLLAIADPQGYVIGTDVAIARRLNLPISELKAAIMELGKPDPDSNSQEMEGRRVIESDCERGYFIVNYRKYRETRDEEQRREYMRDYMRKRRGNNDVAAVNIGKQCKLQLANGEGEAEGESPKPPKGDVNGKKNGAAPTNPTAIRIGAIFNRRPTTRWSEKEIKAFKCLGQVEEDDLSVMEEYYRENSGKPDSYLRRDLMTLLNNFSGELDRAWAYVESKNNGNGKGIPGTKGNPFL